MTNLDQFESVFKAADNLPFTQASIQIGSVLIVTDMDADASDQFATKVRSWLSVLGNGPPAMQWNTVSGAHFSQVRQLLKRVDQHAPDLICTYRNLYISATEFPYSLGVYIDVLTQATSIPVLLVPHPRQWKSAGPTSGTKTVMAITDHLAGDHRLVSFGARFTEPEGTLLLAHIEDQKNFDRFMAMISKIPTIDTEQAREAILEQLLKEPRDYIGSCRQVLQSAGPPLVVQEIVTLGHHLLDYQRLVQQHQVDLLVMNTKDDDQLAMHGLAYPLSVELRETPLLLL